MSDRAETTTTLHCFMTTMRAELEQLPIAVLAERVNESCGTALRPTEAAVLLERTQLGPGSAR